MAQNDTLEAVPTQKQDDPLNLSSGIVKKPTSKPTAVSSSHDDLNLDSGIVKKTGAYVKGQEKKKESPGLLEKAFTPIVKPETTTKITTLGLNLPTAEQNAKLAEKARSEGHWAYGALIDAAGYAGAGERAAGEFLSSMTSPAQIGLTAASAGAGILEEGGYAMLARVAKIPGWAATIGFGAQGAKIASTPQQPGESKYDSMWRQVLGSAAFLGSTEAVWSGAKATFKTALRRHFGLNDDLAGKVSDQVTKIDQARKQAAGQAAQVDAKTKQAITHVQAALQEDLEEIQANTSTRTGIIRQQAEKVIADGKGKITDLQAQRLRAGADVVADTMHALVIEHDRAQKPFIELAAAMPGELADKASVRSIISDNFKQYELDDSQIPSKAVELLKETEGEGKTAEGEAIPSNMVPMKRAGGNVEYVASSRQKEFEGKGYQAIGAEESGNGVSWNRLTAIREDLGQASERATDSRVKAALSKSQEGVTRLQEEIAQKKGYADKYKKAKNEYRDFKRGISSDMVHNWLDAKDAEAQSIAPKVAELTTRENATALRTVLKAAGVDVKPLDDIIVQLKETGTQVKEAGKAAKAEISDTEKGAKEVTKHVSGLAKEEAGTLADLGEEEKSDIAAQEKKDIGKITKVPVIKGENVEDLQGKSNKELLALRLETLANNMQTGGILNGFAFITMLMGLERTITGSIYGPPLALAGYAKLELPRLMRNKNFQDWIISQSGNQPNTPVGNRMRKGIVAMAPILQKALKSGVPQAAAVGAAQQGLEEIPER